MWAAELGYTEIVDVLLDRGADLETRNKVSVQFFRALPNTQGVKGLRVANA